jgi:NADH-quinone oxidoreductase subunit N
VTGTSLFIPTSDDLRPFMAEFFLVGGIAANLLIPFVTRRSNFICAGATLLALLAAVFSLLSMGSGVGAGPHLRGLLLFDSTAYFWKLILLLFVAGVVVMWMDHSGRTLRQGDGPEFFVLLLGATLGMCLMASTTNLLMIFMAIAMASLPSYLLAGFSKLSKRGSEASLKYVLFGAVTGAILIYGISFLYGLYGTLQLTELAFSVPSAALSLALVGLLIGIGFKISAVPMHFWCPDVFEGSTIEVTTFLSVASKGAALVLLLRIVQVMGVTHLGWVVGLLGAITATVGNTGAFTQTNIKRLLAYSSIAQAGYMMCVISAVGGTSAQALLIYLVIYAVMNLGAFAVSAVVIGQAGEQLESFAGLGRSSPLLAGSMFCCLISLIGLPPFAGFGAKVNVLWVLAQQGAFGKALVVVVVLNTVLSAFYYFRIIRVMYLQPSANFALENRLWLKHPVGAILGCACALGLVLMFFLFGPLYSATSRSNPPTIAPVAAQSSPESHTDSSTLPNLKNS